MLKLEYLGEIETKSENTLASLSGAQMGSNHGKKWRSKISWHTPFEVDSSVKEETKYICHLFLIAF